MVYLLTFGISSAFLYLAGKQRSKLLRFSLYAIGLIAPCLLAGLRANTVGADINSYAVYQYHHAIKFDLFYFMEYESSISAAGWNLMTWLSCHFSQSFALYLFCIELLCILPVFFLFFALYRNNEWSGMLSWYLLLYGFSLNGMRQCIAMGIVLFSYLFAKRRKMVPFILAIFVGCLFHQTALIGLFLYPLFGILGKRAARSVRGIVWSNCIYAVALLGIWLALVLFGKHIFTPLTSLKASYAFQLKTMDSMDINWSALFLFSSICFVSYLANKSNYALSADIPLYSRERTGQSKMTVADDALGVVSAFGCLLRELDLVAKTLGRLGLYYMQFACVMTSDLVISKRKNQSAILLFYLLQVLYFVVCFILLGQSDIYPYESSLIGGLFW